VRGRQIRGRPSREAHFPRQPQDLAETEKASDRSPAQAIADIRDLYGASLPVEDTILRYALGSGGGHPMFLELLTRRPNNHHAA